MGNGQGKGHVGRLFVQYSNLESVKEINVNVRDLSQDVVPQAVQSSSPAKRHIGIGATQGVPKCAMCPVYGDASLPVHAAED